MDVEIQNVEVLGDSRLRVDWLDGAWEIEFSFPIRAHEAFLYDLKSASEFRAVVLDGKTNDLRWPSGVCLGGPVLRTWARKSKAKEKSIERSAYLGAYYKEHGEYPREAPDESMQAYNLYLRQMIHVDHMQIPRPPTRFRDPGEARRQMQRAIAANGTGTFSAGKDYARYFLQADARRLIDAGRTTEACAILQEAALVYGDEISAGALAREMLKGQAIKRDVVGARHLFEVAALHFYDEATDLFAHAYLAEMYLAGKAGLVKSKECAIRLYADLDFSPANGDNLTVARMRLIALSKDWQYARSGFEEMRRDEHARKVIGQVKDILSEVGALRE